MSPLEPMDAPLFPFRKELKLYKGPSESDGSPTYNLYDPIRSKYFKINWQQSLILQVFRGGMTASQVAKALKQRTTADISVEEILQFFNGVGRAGLLQNPKGSEELIESVKKMKMGPFKWLLLNYLCIKIPLLSPDQFLSRTLRYVRPLVSKTAYSIYALLTLIGLFGIIQNYQEYFGTFLYFFSLEGLLMFGLARIFAKIIHEFAHAYTAKYYGIHVPTMGILIIVLWPALYTDVTHGWTLRNRRHRLAITIAGVYSEVVLAGITSFLWLITPPGTLHSIFFILSSSSWIMSIFLNLNPALRFDGYYLLSDLWGIDNLQPRAFALTRWQLRKTFLGMDIPIPEEVTKQRLAGIMAYTFYTWAYRIFLYTAIALIVYHQFTKALGVFLFFMEVILFFLWPIYSEIAEQYQLKDYFKKNPRATATFSVIGILFLWILLPLPHASRFPAVTAPIDEQTLYTPMPGIVEKIFIQRDQIVEKGEPLIQLSSPWLDKKINEAKNEIATRDKEILILGREEKTRSYLAQKEAERITYNSLLKEFNAQKSQLTLHSDLSGKLFDWDNDIKVGQRVEANSILGRIADPMKTKVVFYIPDNKVARFRVGDSVTFIVHSPRSSYSGTILQIKPMRGATLQYPALAAHKQLAVKPTASGERALVDSYYEAEMIIEADKERPLRWGIVGEAKATGRWRSLLFDFYRSLMRVLWRESGT